MDNLCSFVSIRVASQTKISVDNSSKTKKVNKKRALKMAR